MLAFGQGKVSGLRSASHRPGLSNRSLRRECGTRRAKYLDRHLWQAAPEFERAGDHHSSFWGSSILRQAGAGERIAKCRIAVAPVAALHAAPDELIAVLIGAVCIASAVHAAAAVGRAQRSKRGLGTLSVFVALITDPALLVTAMRVGWAVAPRLTSVETATGERVTAESGHTIGAGQAGDAPVVLRITAAEARLQAVLVRGARVAVVIHAAQIAWARGVCAAGASDSSTACGCASSG